MTRRQLRYSPVRLELQSRIPHGTAWLFHWAATDGDAIPPDREHRRLHRGEEPIGVAVTNHYRDRILEEANTTRRYWNDAVRSWVAAGIACRCTGYKSVFLFIFDEPACARCGLRTVRNIVRDREVSRTEAGTISYRSERETQSASTGCERKSAHEKGLTALEVQRLKEKFIPRKASEKTRRDVENEVPDV